MEIQHLIKMANSIGSYFASDPDKANGAKGIAEHIKAFWDPRMRRQLMTYVDEGNSSGLDSLVLDALKTHRSLIAG
ncbi:MAG TPA: formate dehydrogenase subunit delta [Terriglobia bacterium]|nr:formate dehydrogenase subunit delta [Terriglobia bacterium]